MSYNRHFLILQVIMTHLSYYYSEKIDYYCCYWEVDCTILCSHGYAEFLNAT